MLILRRPALVATAVAALAVIPSMASAVTWTPSVQIASGQACNNGNYDCYTAAVAVAPDGTTTAAWLQNSSGSTGQIVVSTRRPSGTTFSAPPLNVDGTNSQTLTIMSDNGAYPSVATATDGTTFVAWLDGGNTVKVATRLPAADSFAVEAISSANNASWPSIAAGANGAATVAWAANGNTYTSTRPAGTNSSFATTPVSMGAANVGQFCRAAVAMAPDGTTAVAWVTTAGGLFVRTRPANSATWDSAQSLGSNVITNGFSMAAGRDNTLAITWADNTGDVKASVRPAGAATAFGTAAAFPTKGFNPDVTVDPSGSAHVVVTATDANAQAFTDFTASTLASPYASFGTAAVLGPVGQTGSYHAPMARIAASGDGSVTVAYMAETGVPGSCQQNGSCAIKAFTKPSDSSSYDAGVALSSASTAPSNWTVPAIAGGPGNLAAVVWPAPSQSDAIATAWTLPVQRALTVTKAGTGGGTVTSAPAGIDCGPTCTADFDDASTVTLTAAPASGSTFAGWSGAGCSGTGTCVVTMSGAQGVTATFDPAPASGGAPGQASTGASGSTSGTTPAPSPLTFGVTVPDSLAKAGLPVSAGGTVGLPLACPSGIPGGCDASGVLSLRLPGSMEGKGRRSEQASRTKVLARFSGVEIASGKKRLYSVRLAPATYNALRKAGVRRVPATLRIVNRLDNGKPVVTRERVWLRILPLAVPVTG